jgi:CheY-like chemotaxis protein
VPLVISDWMMPDLDGIELCAALRGAEPALLGLLEPERAA